MIKIKVTFYLYSGDVIEDMVSITNEDIREAYHSGYSFNEYLRKLIVKHFHDNIKKEENFSYCITFCNN